MSSTEYELEIDRIKIALSYNGFDPTKLRPRLIESFDRMELIQAVSAYVVTGNNLAAKTTSKKVTDSEVAKELVKFYKDHKIDSKRTSLDAITPARIALCFPAIVGKVRMAMNLPTSVETSTPTELRDLCFNGFADFPSYAAAQDFISKFSFVIGKAADKDLTKEKSDERVKQFRELSKAGNSKDSVGTSVMNSDWRNETLDAILTAYGYPASKLEAKVRKAKEENKEKERAKEDQNSSKKEELKSKEPLEEEGTKVEKETKDDKDVEEEGDSKEESKVVQVKLIEKPWEIATTLEQRMALFNNMKDPKPFLRGISFEYPVRQKGESDEAFTKRKNQSITQEATKWMNLAPSVPGSASHWTF